MMKFVYPLFLSLCIMICFFSSKAQISEEDFLLKYNHIINEKLKIAGNDDNKVENEEKNVKMFSTKRSLGKETQITTSPIAESEVHAALNPTDSNNWVVCPIKLPSSASFTLPIYFTKDFGKNWQQSSFLPTPANPSANVLGGGDPVFAFDDNGKLYLTWIHLSMEGLNNYTWALLWAYSEDGGSSWKKDSNNYVITSSGTSLYTLPIISDKQWMAVDRSHGINHNTLYVAYLRAEMTSQSYRIVLSRKPADSAGFVKTQTVVSNSSFAEVQFSQIVVDDSGFVHVVFYGSPDKVNFGFYHSISKDGGISFSNPVKITSFQKTTAITGIKGGAQPRIYPSPALAIDNNKNSPYKGRMYLTWTGLGIDSNAGNASDIYLCWSDQQGTSWSKPIIVNDDNKSHITEQYYSSISVNNNGVLFISWYDGRHSESDVANNAVQYYVAHSFDGGQTFTANYNVSKIHTDFQTVGLRNNSFGIGEYNQLLSTEGFCIPVWSDGRKGNGDLDIFVAVVEILREPSHIKEVYTVDNHFLMTEPSPNPATEKISFELNLKEPAHLNIRLISADGKWSKVYYNQYYQSGEQFFEMDIRKLTTGVYFIQAESSQAISIKRVVVVKE